MKKTFLLLLTAGVMSGRGKQTTAPWFATWEELMNNDNRYGK